MNGAAGYDCDLLVIGAGSGGVRAARVAASLGARVMVCESAALGGTCVNVGCVPKKLMVLGAHFADEWRDAAGYGWDVQPPTHQWSALIANKDAEIARLNGVYQRLLEGRGVEILRGRGSLVGPHRARVVGPEGAVREVSAAHVLLAVGGKPVRPTIPGAEHVWVSDDVFHLNELPRRVLVVGGGYIAVEFAGIFHGLGAQVTQIYRGPLFLRGFDRDVRVHLDEQMRHKGIDLRFHRDLRAVARIDERTLEATLDDGERLEVGGVLAAIGRVPNTRELGLEALGVRTSASGAVLVDERFRTSVPWIYAVGDVIERVQLTPVALAEGMIVARNLFGGESGRASYDMIPSAVFSNPPIGTVGLSEDEAREELGAVDVYRSTFTAMKATLTGRGDRTLMKLVVDRRSQRVVGVHMVGPEAGEIIQGFAVALKCGATKQQFDATIGIHPTAAEELVTMRERCAEPDHDQTVAHVEPRLARKIVHHRWEHED